MSSNRLQLEGKVFNYLTVLKDVGNTGFDRHEWSSSWVCICTCGNIITVRGSDLKNENTKSCGCISIMHGHATRKGGRSPEYNAWISMKQRCYNPNNPRYKDYGNRGIIVCQRWLDSFSNFIIDMGLKPSPNHSIDRYPDNDGDYGPNNCRWATIKEQNNNKRQRTSKLVTNHGIDTRQSNP